MSKIRLAGVVKESSVDGEGLRYVVFTQGCHHKCKGCHNTQTHNISDGVDVDIDKIISDVNKNPLLNGVTISGGEPLLQIDNLIPLLEGLKKYGKHIMMYTGYTYEAICSLHRGNCIGFENVFKLLSYVDVLVDGKFVEELKSVDCIYRGSTNQRLIDVPKTLESGHVCEYELDKDLVDEMSSKSLDEFLNLD